MARLLASIPEIPANVFTDRAAEYLRLAHQSAGQALAAMDQLRKARMAKAGSGRRGTTSDQDQDLLRAMLVFACAGLDASMKALIEDALPTLADRDLVVQVKLEEFAGKLLAGPDARGTRAMARIVVHPTSPRAALVTEFVEELTGGSLQSVDELQRVRSALGIDDNSDVARSIVGLKGVFGARNEISHEMDLTGPSIQRRRRHRGISDMVTMADSTLAVGAQIVSIVESATRQT